VSNFWSRQETGRFDAKTLTRKDLYYCRRWRIQAETKGKSVRDKPITKGTRCGMRFKLYEFYEPDCALPTRIKIVAYGDCSEHAETMEQLDKFKRCKALMKLAGTEMQKRYKPSEIKDAIRSNSNPAAHAEFKAAGGQFFTIKDVHNAGAEWKKKNPNTSFIGANLDEERQWLDLAEWLNAGKLSVQLSILGN